MWRFLVANMEEKRLLLQRVLFFENASSCDRLEKIKIRIYMKKTLVQKLQRLKQRS